MGLTVCLKGLNCLEISAALGGAGQALQRHLSAEGRSSVTYVSKHFGVLKYYKLFNRVLSVEECLFFPIRGLTSFVLLQYIDKLQTGKLN